MAISSALGTGSLTPGVCTSSTRPTAPFEGQMIYETDTDRVLIWNNSAWVAPNSQTANPPGLELIKTHTVTSAASSFTVTDAFSANFENYIVVASNVNTSTAAGVTFRIGSATANYYWGGIVVFYSGSASAGESGNNVAQWATGMVSDNTGGAGATINIYNPFTTLRSSYTTFGVDSRTSGAGSRSYSGFLNDTTSHSTITFLSTAGNITSGTIRVYGMRN